MPIPKIIHYCWFGGKEKPDIVKRCIASWHNHLTGYQFIEWNENNFDTSSNIYVKEAYEAGKFAFVSDYARVYVLYHYGGIYLDTDVEVFKSFDDLLHHESFWGFEQENYIATSTIGAAKENKLIQVFMDSYHTKSFILADGTFDSLTNVAMITKILGDWGVTPNGSYQDIEGVGTFYPQTYFSPYDYINCRNFMTENTYAMHHFYKSWLPPKARWKGRMKLLLARIIGGHNIARIRAALRGIQ
ncbi:glycosyl transferase [Paenibacillus alginolyticus]|uniref:Glycosyl transferase n=1 Tax=Paenibacillus alginolyticus TaxID=59839 RepID=A0ABT4G8W0_9BACL|nr:glycosyltransferase [Paenibacillus alginolyticus]MCY9664542.1 glycosyl transferase [Paenibacillus alginolyticus]MCY9692624.1 glycosyl transferase [Paenibacillus alginolyticus]MEC0143831.1 capsular polysaccharide synthesis protein [Paenibacillus alginolyticus]